MAGLPEDIIKVIQNKKQSIEGETAMHILEEFVIPWMYYFRLATTVEQDEVVLKIGNLRSIDHPCYESSFWLTAMKRVSKRLRKDISAGEGTSSCWYNGHVYFKGPNDNKLKRFA